MKFSLSRPAPLSSLVVIFIFRFLPLLFTLLSLFLLCYISNFYHLSCRNSLFSFSSWSSSLCSHPVFLLHNVFLLIFLFPSPSPLSSQLCLFNLLFSLNCHLALNFCHFTFILFFPHWLMFLSLSLYTLHFPASYPPPPLLLPLLPPLARQDQKASTFLSLSRHPPLQTDKHTSKHTHTHGQGE